MCFFAAGHYSSGFLSGGAEFLSWWPGKAPWQATYHPHGEGVWGFGSRTVTSHPVRVFGCPVHSGRAEHSSPLPIPKTVDKGAPRVAYTIAHPCYLLARRAVRLDPLTALRCQ
jgi:hypothetical protein